MRSFVFGLGMAVLCAGASMADDKTHSALDFKVKTIDGKDVSLSKYKGKVVLIVNVASQCGFTGQYKGLEALSKKYKAEGLEVLGFPANEFGSQEPGTNAEIKEFCTSKYGVDFDMFEKVVVKGAGQADLFKYLTKNAEPKGDIQWNFEKFLIGRDGSIVGRYNSAVKPQGSDLEKKVVAELAKK